MEAGNRCFDQRVPEEINRRIVDHVADINLTYSSIARDYLLREGLSPDMIIKIGSPMFEVLSYYRPQIEESDVLIQHKLDFDKTHANSYAFFICVCFFFGYPRSDCFPLQRSIPNKFEGWYKNRFQCGIELCFRNK
jgi:hypothetical protein